MVLLFKLKIEPFFGGVYPEKIQWLLKLATIYYILVKQEINYAAETKKSDDPGDAPETRSRES